MIRRTQLSRRTLCRLSDVERSPEPLYFRQAQHNYLDRLKGWLGDVAVVDYHTSKSCRFPLVKAAHGVLLGYNLYDYVVFVPRAIWRRLGSAAKSRVPKQRMRWHSSFVRWRPGRGEVLLVGGVEMVEALLAVGVLAKEAGK